MPSVIRLAADSAGLTLGGRQSGRPTQATSPIPHALDQFVEGLVGVHLGAQLRLQRVHPALGVLAGGGLERAVEPRPPHRSLSRDTAVCPPVVPKDSLLELAFVDVVREFVVSSHCDDSFCRQKKHYAVAVSAATVAIK